MKRTLFYAYIEELLMYTNKKSETSANSLQMSWEIKYCIRKLGNLKAHILPF